MSDTDRRRAAARVVLVAALVATAGCNWWFGRFGGAGGPRPIVARNHGYFDVTVHALPGGSADGRRLGTVRGYATAALALRRGDLRPGDELVVRVRVEEPPGEPREWVSPAVAIGADEVARLDVRTSSDGRLEGSTLTAGRPPDWPRAGASPREAPTAVVPSAVAPRGRPTSARGG